MDFVDRCEGRTFSGHHILFDATPLLGVGVAAVFTSTNPVVRCSGFNDHGVIVFMPE